jgi:hypothetical protein
MPESLTIQHFKNFVNLLEEFQEHDNYLLNLSKLFEFWKISKEEIEPFVLILIRLQSLITNGTKPVRLFGIWKESQIYLKLKTLKELNSNNSGNFKEIELDLEDSNLLNDAIHYFEHINIGKGFNLKVTNSEFAEKIRTLYKKYPFFFENRGNGTIFPTKLASQLGKTISYYKKSNHILEDINMEGYHIRVR